MLINKDAEITIYLSENTYVKCAANFCTIQITLKKSFNDRQPPNSYTLAFGFIKV